MAIVPHTTSSNANEHDLYVSWEACSTCVKTRKKMRHENSLVKHEICNTAPNRAEMQRLFTAAAFTVTFLPSTVILQDTPCNDLVVFRPIFRRPFSHRKNTTTDRATATCGEIRHSDTPGTPTRSGSRSAISHQGWSYLHVSPPSICPRPRL